MRHSLGVLPLRLLTVPAFGRVKEASVFIVWGKKVVDRKLGHVAGFCPMCREPKTFLPRRVGAAGHVYCLSTGEGGLIGHERNPASLSQEGRDVLIRNSFLSMSAKMEQRLAPAHIDSGMSLALVGALATLVFGPHLALSMFPDMDAVRLFIFLATVAVTGVVWQVMASRTRFVRGAVLPALAAALRPLAPTPAELEAVVTQLTHLKHQMARRIKVPELQARLAAAIPA